MLGPCSLRSSHSTSPRCASRIARSGTPLVRHLNHDCCVVVVCDLFDVYILFAALHKAILEHADEDFAFDDMASVCGCPNMNILLTWTYVWDEFRDLVSNVATINKHVCRMKCLCSELSTAKYHLICLSSVLLALDAVCVCLSTDVRVGDRVVPVRCWRVVLDLVPGV